MVGRTLVQESHHLHGRDDLSPQFLAQQFEAAVARAVERSEAARISQPRGADPLPDAVIQFAFAHRAGAAQLECQAFTVHQVLTPDEAATVVFQ